jgi:hypothetical protein
MIHNGMDQMILIRNQRNCWLQGKIFRIFVLDALRINFSSLCNTQHWDIPLIGYWRNDTIKTTLTTINWRMTNRNLRTKLKQKTQYEDAFLRKKLKQPWKVWCFSCNDSKFGQPTNQKCKSLHREDDDDDDNDNNNNNNNNWSNSS